MKLAIAVSRLSPGEYSFEEFVGSQSLFTEAELYEALVNQQARERKRKQRQRAKHKQHLKLVG